MKMTMLIIMFMFVAIRLYFLCAGDDELKQIDATKFFDYGEDAIVKLEGEEIIPNTKSDFFKTLKKFKKVRLHTKLFSIGGINIEGKDGKKISIGLLQYDRDVYTLMQSITSTLFFEEYNVIITTSNGDYIGDLKLEKYFNASSVGEKEF